MKAAQINKYGSSEIVEINPAAPAPTVGVGKVLVQVYAAGLNPIDWKVMQGYLQKMVPLQFPVTLGGDFSGIVTDVGPGVVGFTKGDAVYGQAIILAGGSGSLAQVVAAKAANVAAKPKNISHTQAAALPLAAVSALQGLTEHIGLTKGQKILIYGGAGGIGSFAIQLAKHLGAYVATTASGDDTEFVKKLGADVVIDYKTQKFADILHDYDGVFDTVGGETYTRSFTILKKNGVIVSMTEQPNTELMTQYGVTAISQQSRVTTERLTKVTKLVEAGALQVYIDTTFPLDQAGAALAHLQTGHPRGKVVVEVKQA